MTQVLSDGMSASPTVITRFVSNLHNKCQHYKYITAAMSKSLNDSSNQTVSHIAVGKYRYCLSIGGAAVRRRTRDRKVTGSTPSRGTIKSTRSTQSSIPLR